MAKNPEVLSQASRDIVAIAQRAKTRVGTQAGYKAMTRLRDGIALLEDMPYLGPKHRDPALAARGFRRLVLGRYVVLYRVEQEHAVIYRVLAGGAKGI